MRRAGGVAVLVALGALAACGDGSGPAPPPAAVVAVTALPVNGTVGAALAASPAFEVRTEDGRPLAGVPVTVAVASGGGTLAGAPAVSLQGPTPIGQWTLGTTTGAQTVTVTVAGLTPLTITAQAAPGAPTALELIEGNDQFGVSGLAAGIAVRVRVRDAFDNGVPGVQVAWSVDLGGGNVAAPTSVSDASGIAAAPTWTLGPDDGEHGLVATVGALTVRARAFTGIVPASITVEVAPPSSAVVASTLAPAPAFAVRDSGGVAIGGFPLAVAVTAGGGALAGAPTASAAGPTPIGAWTLGTQVSTQVVTVTVPGLAPLEFSLETFAGAVFAVQPISATATALAGDVVTTAPRVRLFDEHGNRVTGATVNWSVSQGTGALSGGTQSVSDGQGEASAPTWRLGRHGGPQQLTASVNGRTAVLAGGILSNYNIDLRFLGPAPTTDVVAAFTRARHWIEAAVVGDKPGATLNNLTVSCLPAQHQVTLTETLDDVIIFAIVDSIDGPGGVLGSAGPCFFRTADSATAIGVMRFDRDDLQNLLNQDRLDAVIMHEMLHVLGIGITGLAWGNRLVGAGSSTVQFTGTEARSACETVHGGAFACATGVPAENCLDLSPGTNCGAGTQDSHWKESVFQTELMTGYLGGGSNPFSEMSIRALADLSYQVNILAADPYTVPSPNLVALRADFGAFALRMPAPLAPTGSIDRMGRVTPFAPR